MSPTAWIVLSVAIVSVLGGCGDDEASVRTEPEARLQETSPLPDRATGGSTVEGGANSQGDPGARTVPTSDGTPAVILPARPTAMSVRGGAGCVAQGTIGLPPRPGLRARLVGRTVGVNYTVGSAPARCRPKYLRLTLNVSADGQTDARTYRVDAAGSGHRRMAIPEYFAATPDVVRASTVTRDGRRSPVVSVRIRGSLGSD